VDLNYRTNLIFPVPLHQFDVNGFDRIQDKLIDYAYCLKRKDLKGRIASNSDGWQSNSFSITNQNDELHNFLMSCVTTLPFIKKEKNILSSAWVNINPTGGCNKRHNHPNCDLAGVLWVKCPQNCGEIIFYNPNNFEISNTLYAYDDQFKVNTGVQARHIVTPIEGKILIFPSHLDHEVEKNKSNQDRISVSFNIVFK
tara:strand:- start:62 stop:655 length:594 start_codon:yes stop_codon:yes gene_type:complete